MKTYQQSLRNLGIGGCENIPLSVLISGNIVPEAYDISEEDISKLNALRDIVTEYNKSSARRKASVRSSLDVAEIMAPQMKGLDHEELWVIYLNSKSKVIDRQRITVGSSTATICDNKRIIRQALSCSATSLIMVHNHPSGDPMPSKADITMTEKLKKACEALDIALLDHVIIGSRCHYSFAEETEFENS